jgi:6,7-dimethyl-8-ribityllumazine synthase
MYNEAKRARFVIVASRFNKDIVDRLVEGAQATFARYEVVEVPLFWVPGAFELPLMAKRIASTGRCDAILCLGAIIRGETAHFEHVATQAASGILQASLETEIPIIFSVLTTENIEQARARSQIQGKNEGARGALSAMEMVHQLRAIETTLFS